jgi:hypothetical protein
LVPAAAQTKADSDAAGCKDHPLFTRMQNMRIITCKTSEFESFGFRTGKANQRTPVEGRRFETRYQVISGNQAPSPVASIRNHQQAIKGIGGTVVYEDQRYTTLKVSKDGKEIWAEVDTAWGGGYVLTIVEKQAMVQQVTANAESFDRACRPLVTWKCPASSSIPASPNSNPNRIPPWLKSPNC